jgi:hypothetical protein
MEKSLKLPPSKKKPISHIPNNPRQLHNLAGSLAGFVCIDLKIERKIIKSFDKTKLNEQNIFDQLSHMYSVNFSF